MEKRVCQQKEFLAICKGKTVLLKCGDTYFSVRVSEIKMDSKYFWYVYSEGNMGNIFLHNVCNHLPTDL